MKSRAPDSNLCLLYKSLPSVILYWITSILFIAPGSCEFHLCGHLIMKSEIQPVARRFTDNLDRFLSGWKLVRVLLKEPSNTDFNDVIIIV